MKYSDSVIPFYALRRASKMAQLNSVVFAMFSQAIKKTLAEIRKCLIIR